MIDFDELDRRIGHISAAAIVADAFGTGQTQALSCASGSPGKVARNAMPDRVSFADHVAQAGDDEVVLRAEVTIKRHIVDIGRVRDGVDADPANPGFRKRSRAMLMMRSRGFSGATPQSSMTIFLVTFFKCENFGAIVLD